MRARTTGILLVLVLVAAVGCGIPRDMPEAHAARVERHVATPFDAEVERLMQQQRVNGLALASIEGGKVAHVAAYGHRNVARGLPLTTTTVMCGASLTKSAFAYLVLHGVTSRRISPTATDSTERWSRTTSDSA